MEIKLTEEQMTRLKNGEDIVIKSPYATKGLEWNYPDNATFLIDGCHITGRASYDSNINDMNIKYGLYRVHKHNAEHSLQLSKETNLIGAIAEQISSDDKWEPDWRNPKQLKYYINIVHNDIEQYDYSVSYDISKRVLGVHYMSEQTAKAVCKILNKDKSSTP